MAVRLAVLMLAIAAMCGCGAQRADESAAGPQAVGPQSPPEASPVLDQPAEDVPPATAGEEALGSLRAQLPAEGTITFEGFGPAKFGATAEEVRMAWGSDLGDAQPSEPGGCYYLIPQPVGPEGYRTAFMVEGDRFARIDVRDAEVTAPGGGKVGLTLDEVRTLYPGRIEEQPHKYDPDGKVLRVTDAGSGSGALVFELDGNDRVVAWRIGIPPQVDYVEGCS